MQDIPEAKNYSKVLRTRSWQMYTLYNTEEIVVEMLGNLKVDKTTGIDEIHPKFLKEVRYEIGAWLEWASLAYLMNPSRRELYQGTGGTPLLRHCSKKEAGVKPVITDQSA